MIQFYMPTVTPFPRRIRWDQLSAADAEFIIRAWCPEDDTDKVIITDHAEDRILERGITQADVYRILREGFCDEPKKNEKGQWQTIVSMRLKGSREAGVVTVIIEDKELLVVRTVQWM